jgi:hypothetical protein
MPVHPHQGRASKFDLVDGTGPRHGGTCARPPWRMTTLVYGPNIWAIPGPTPRFRALIGAAVASRLPLLSAAMSVELMTRGVRAAMGLFLALRLDHGIRACLNSRSERGIAGLLGGRIVSAITLAASGSNVLVARCSRRTPSATPS